MSKYNRPFVIGAFLVLVGWLAYIMPDKDITAIIAAAVGPVAAYIGIKGQDGGKGNGKEAV